MAIDTFAPVQTFHIELCEYADADDDDDDRAEKFTAYVVKKNAESAKFHQQKTGLKDEYQKCSETVKSRVEDSYTQPIKVSKID